MTLFINRFVKYFLLCYLVSLLTACDGGGGGSVPRPQNPDTVAPEIVSITPAIAGTEVALNDTIDIEFNETIIDYGTINVRIEPYDANNNLVSSNALDLSFSYNQKTLSITPLKLVEATKYQIIIREFKDKSNNVMQGNCTWQFVTRNYQGPAASISRLGNCGKGLIIPREVKLSVTFGIKQLKFNWQAFSTADYYTLLENNGAGLGFKQIATNLTNLNYDHDIAIHKTDWINSSYLLEACFITDNYCVPSNEISIIDQASKTIGFFKASNTGTNDMFGVKVALSGDGLTLAVATHIEANGTPGVINNTGFPTPTTVATNALTRAGAVYLFTRKAGIWAQQAYIKPHNPGTLYHFGVSIALSKDGQTLAVGANNEASNNKGVFNLGSFPTDNTAAATSGAVYVFARDSNGDWGPEAYIKAHNTRANGYFGAAVALSSNGQTLAVIADGEDNAYQGVVNGLVAITATSDNTNNRDSGAAYIYLRSNKTWEHQAYIKTSNASPLDYLSSVALSSDGQTLVVGAFGEDSEKTGVTNAIGFPDRIALSADLDSIPANNTGAVYIFTSTAKNWSQQAYIKASNKDIDDRFGIALALSQNGQTLVVGANGESSIQTGVISNSATISGDNSLTNAGAVYVYSRSAGNWAQQAYVKASNPGAGDYFGTALAVSGDGMLLAIAAYTESSKQLNVITSNNMPTPQTENNDALNSGAVYLFRNLSGIWQQQAFIKANNTITKYNFGNAVALGGRKLANGSFTIDGSSLAIGSLNDASSNTGVINNNIVPDTNNSATSAGAVYLY